MRFCPNFVQLFNLSPLGSPLPSPSYSHILSPVSSYVSNTIDHTRGTSIEAPMSQLISPSVVSAPGHLGTNAQGTSSAGTGTGGHQHNQINGSPSAHHLHQIGHHRPPTLPHNISITLIKWFPLPSIRVQWSYTPPTDVPTCEAFRIIYHPIKSRLVCW